MNRTLIALGVAAAVALPVVAEAAPKVYGKINLSAEQYKKDVDNTPASSLEYTRLLSNASRFGVKGEDELTATLSAVYQFEWEVGADGEDKLTASSTSSSSGGITTTTTTSLSSGADLTQRNRFVGIKSQSLGTVKFGKYDSYTKLAQGEIDLFNDYEGDMKYVIAGETRLNNVVGYESPSFAGLTVNVLAQTQDSNSASGNAQDRRSGSSASVVYSNEELGLYAALAIDSQLLTDTALFGKRESDNLRVVASYKVADLTLNGIYQTSSSVKPTGVISGDEAGWQLGAAYKLGDETLKAQYGIAEADDSAAATQKHTLWSVGVDHNFSSKTKAFVWYTNKDEDLLAPANDSQIKVAALGVEHKF